ncbi:MAG: D-arginine dehydrogenase [Paracoccaceae bacterium]
MPQNTKDNLTVDIVVIGAGIAGASVAAALAGHGKTLLLEMEPQPGYHTTGRSAAMFVPSYGPAPIRALTRASRAFFEQTPKGFTQTPLLSPRQVLMVARKNQDDALDAAIAELSGDPNVARISGAETQQKQPLLRDGYANGAMFDSGGHEIDVAALHQGYLRQFKGLGGVLLTNSQVLELTKHGENWDIQTAKVQISAPIVVNAAGAWADEIAALAGIDKVDLVPKRRTVLMVENPLGSAADRTPITIDIDEQFFLKPDAGKLLISPADETPSPPCDAQPDEMDVAICVDRIQSAFEISVRRIESQWAGLRSFVADKAPVSGYSNHTKGFFWLAGQGGYGIQSAPALSQFSAAEILGNPVPQFILDEGLEPGTIAPSRLGA